METFKSVILIAGIVCWIWILYEMFILRDEID